MERSFDLLRVIKVKSTEWYGFITADKILESDRRKLYFEIASREAGVRKYRSNPHFLPYNCLRQWPSLVSNGSSEITDLAVARKIPGKYQGEDYYTVHGSRKWVVNVAPFMGLEEL